MNMESVVSTKVGINYKGQIRDDILANAHHLEILEVTTEKLFIQDDDPVLRELLHRLPLSLHGLDMSLGSTSPLDPEYLGHLERTLSICPHEWFSDHVSLTSEGGTEVGHLMPMRMSEEAIHRAVEKIRTVRKFSNKPFLLENITYYYPIPGSTVHEADFIRTIIEAADCGMLLDVNNLYINSVNFRFDPVEYARRLPLNRVVEMHLAGGSHKFGMVVDTHATDVWDEVWALFDKLCAITRPKAVIVERDANLGNFSDTIRELTIAREILSKHGLRASASLGAAA